VQFGTRARPPFADRSGRNGGGNGGAGSNSGGRGGHWGNGHRGRRSSPSGRPPRGGFSPHPSPRFHTNNVSVPEQGDDDAVRQIVQANSASPHFVGAAINSAKGKEPVESSTTMSRSAQAVLPPGSTLSPGPSTPGSGASSSLLLPIHQTRQTYQRSP
jgi:hypothetical protein